MRRVEQLSAGSAITAVLVWLVLTTVAAPAGAASPDVSGSRDPFGVDRVPRSWIVEYQRDYEVRPRDVVLGKVDSIRRDLRIEDQITVQAALETVTYQMPDGVPVDAVVAHYARELGSDVLYQCTGRACGRSTDWANQVFGQAVLYGPDRNQRYVAREWQGRLVALYVIERGNQRVYAHLRFYEAEGSFAIQPNALLARRLSERGWATVEAVSPGADGSLADGADEVLGALAGALAEFGGQELYLVCHLYGDESVEALLATSLRCAENGIALIEAAGDTAGGDSAAGEAAANAEPLQLRPFGAGPLLPRTSADTARLELVLPAVVTALLN